MNKLKLLIAGMVAFVWATDSLALPVNGAMWNAPLTASWSVGTSGDETFIENDGLSVPMDESDSLMTNDVDPDNGGDGPPPDPLPVGNGLSIFLWISAAYVAYKFRRQRR